MTVGAVSGIYQYSSAAQTQFFSITASSERIAELMTYYGIKETGDDYTDMRALYQAMYNSYTQSASSSINAQESNRPQPQAQTPAWAPLMAQVGLPTTGDLQKDYAAFMNKISQLEAAAGSDKSKKASAENLAIQAQSAFVAPAQAQGADNSMFSGAMILSDLNRSLVVNNFR